MSAIHHWRSGPLRTKMVHKVEVGSIPSQEVLGIAEGPKDKGLLTGVIAESC